MAFDLEMIRKVYAALPGKVQQARTLLGRPLTLAEKILYAHMSDMPSAPYQRGASYVDFNPDRVAMQDATAQMALLQFMSAGIPQVAVPSTVHCDHLIRAEHGADNDLKQSLIENDEVFAFLGLGKLCIPRWHDDRYRFSHTECWWTRNDCNRSWWCRCR